VFFYRCIEIFRLGQFSLFSLNFWPRVLKKSQLSLPHEFQHADKNFLCDVMSKMPFLAFPGLFQGSGFSWAFSSVHLGAVPVSGGELRVRVRSPVAHFLFNAPFPR
jgi:hypothetical protein